jgi:D-glycero-beta-D-manno-heptose 1-phosphate adenylyltransferase
MIQEIEKKIILSDRVESFRNLIKEKRIIFTNGCFDILHIGHLTYLSEARDLGDFLWLGLNSDSSVKILKGESRPINAEINRALLLASLFFVDAVTIFSEQTPLNLIEKIKPNIHVKGGDYIAEQLPEYNIIRSYGGEVKILPFVEGHSTTSIIDRIKNYNS